MKRSLIHNAIASLYVVLEEAPEGGLLGDQLESIGSTIEHLTKLTTDDPVVGEEKKPPVAKPKTAKKVTKKKVKKQVKKEEPVEEEDDLLSADDLDDLDLDAPIDDEPEDDDLTLDDDDLADLEDEFSLEDDPIAEEGSDPMIEEAFNLLKDESKPSFALLQNKLRIGKVRATEIFNQLVEEGRITKPKRAARKTKTIDDLLAEIPEGDDPIVETWFARLLNLDEDRRVKYIVGVDLKDVVTMKGVRAAVKAGGDMTLINEITNHAKTQISNVRDPIEDFTSTPEAKKYGALIASVNKVLDDGGKLYDHMTRHGCNKDTLRDLRDIAKAVKG